MKEFVKTLIERLKVLYCWIFKICLAKDHFKVAPWTKLRLNLQGYLVDQYWIYDFKNRDRKEYLSELDWFRSRRINGEYSFILNNKMVCSDMLKQYTWVPEVYASKIGGRIRLADGAPADTRDVLRCLRQVGKVIMKPINCGKGQDVHLISWEQDRYLLDCSPITEEALLRLLDKHGDWFLSAYIRQAAYLNEIYDQTANTLRVIALRDTDDGSFRIFYAVQRIGTEKTVPVDNGSRGGLVAKVDMQTGQLSEAKSLHNLDVHEFHPNSAKPIKGVVIPNWQELKQQILELSGHFPYLSFIAWDILVTDDGFCVIEANTSSGVNIIQLWGGQRNGELGNFYRKHGIIK